MATKAGKFSKRAQGSTLGKLVDEVLYAGASKDKAGQFEVDFIESAGGLGLTLYPVQRMIAKAIFGTPLDYRQGIVDVWDPLKDKLLYRMSETEYLRYLYEEGKANAGDWQSLPQRGFGTALIAAGRRSGKAICVDQLIPTPNGFVRNGDLKTGDMVFTASGEPTRIKYAHDPFMSPVYRVYFDDNSSVVTHPGHLWHTFTRKERKNTNRRLTRKEPPNVPDGFCKCGCGEEAPVARRDNPKTGVKAGDILPCKQLHHTKYRPRYGSPILGDIRTTEEILLTLTENTGNKIQANHAVRLPGPIQLPEADLPIDPYCFGAWLGDGNSAGAQMTGIDPEILMHFTNAGYDVSQKKDPKRWSIKGGLQTQLRLLGVLKNKHIPKKYLWASIEQRLALLQGLMDTDGTCAEDGSVEFCNKRRDISQGVYHLAASLGLKPTWSGQRSTLYGKDCGPRFRVAWTGGLPVFRLPRKLERLKTTFKSTQNWRYITHIEPAGHCEVRCITVEDPSGLFLVGTNFNVTHNSALVSGVGCACLRNLLSIYDPQEYYGLVQGSDITFTLIGTDQESSDRLYNKMKADINRSPFYGPYMRSSPTSKEMRFVSEADRGRRDIEPSIAVASFPCTTRAARGISSLFLALDEFSHYVAKRDSNSNDLFLAATPSTSQFPSKDDPDRSDAKILIISSPLNKVGKFYELHRHAMDKGVSSDIFTINVPTSQMNPKIPRSSLLSEWEKNGNTFKAEFGGEFLDGSGSFVPAIKYDACVDTHRSNLTRFDITTVGRKYFWGLDYAMRNDGTALAISHLELVDDVGIVLIFDYIDRMIVGEAFDGPGLTREAAANVANLTELNLVEVVSWLTYMHQILPCFRGLVDQHGGATLRQLLQMQGLTAMSLEHLNEQTNSKMYNSLRSYVSNGRARFPNVPKFANEFKQLEASYKSKYVLKVEAPGEKDAHDDMADAAALSAWQAQTWLEEHGMLDLDPSAKILQIDPRITNPTGYINPNDVTLRDLQIRARQSKMGEGLLLPPNLPVVQNPFGRRR